MFPSSEIWDAQFGGKIVGNEVFRGKKMMQPVPSTPPTTIGLTALYLVIWLLCWVLVIQAKNKGLRNEP